ncbi:SBBP repeat-containing protein [Adhaeribacter aquaticus]|uniref:Ig-like domain-containing protein n=1 Tax=Adhaeribacter aquaticus TaxID=299567 RepID=UPI0003FED984|nr:SBBP repeat-containing protein [Adhaeribacter aquaticus]
MKKFYKFFLLCLLGQFLIHTYALAQAQAPDFIWANRIGEDTYRSASSLGDKNDIARDASGNIYVSGNFESSITFGNITLNSSGDYDLFIAKYDPAGNVLWAKSAGGSGSDKSRSIAVDGAGNVYITGRFKSSRASFGSFTLSNTGDDDVFIAKYDASGNIIWAKSAGGTSTDQGNGIAVDRSGNVYVTGSFYTTVSFGGTTLTSTGDREMFIAKYDGSGNLLWAKSAGGPYHDHGMEVAVDGSGNAYIIGEYYKTGTFGGVLLTSDGDSDIFVAKYNSSGNVVWAQTGGASGTFNDKSQTIAVDASGNAFVTGSFTGTGSFGSSRLQSRGMADYFLVKYSSENGSVEWAKSYGDTGDDTSYGITLDDVGQPLVTGETESRTGTGIDVFVTQFDQLGGEQWTKNAGGSGSDYGQSLVAFGGNIYLTGEYSGNATFGGKTLTARDKGIFVAKLSSSSPAPIVTPPTVKGGRRCFAGDVTLEAAGGNNGEYRWYTTATGGTAIPYATNATYTTPMLSATTTYYVSLVSGSYESERVPVTATIDNGPGNNRISGGGDFCYGETVRITGSVPNGLDDYVILYKWRMLIPLPSGGTEFKDLHQGFTTDPNYSVGAFPPGINGYLPRPNGPRTFQVERLAHYSGGGGCPSFSNLVTINVLYPVEPPLATPYEVENCGPGKVTLTATGGSNGEYRWYTTATGGTAIPNATSATFTTPELTATTTYYVSLVSGSCESSRTPIKATIKALPSAPTVSNFSYQQGAMAPALTATGSNLLWYTAATGGTGSATAPTPSTAVAGTTNYYVSQTLNSCESPRAAITVTITPAIPISFNLGSVNGQQGSEVIFPVRVSNFRDIISMQGSVQWNSSVATFVGVEYFGIAGLTSANFGTTAASSGQLSFSWNQTATSPFSLPDNTILFAVRLRLVGSPGASTIFSLSSSPVKVEFINNNLASVTVGYNSGQVSIDKEVVISGTVKSLSGTPLKDVVVKASSSAGKQHVVTPASGAFSFKMSEGTAHVIAPASRKEVTATNGITTLDIVQIQRHILGIQPLASPFKIIAADVSGSSSVTSTDIVYIRSLILGNTRSFPNNKMWAFVKNDFAFPNSRMPFPYDSVRSYSTVTDQSSQDFIGIKLGDVNDSWDVNTARIAVAGELQLQVADQQVSQGTEVVVPVTATNFDDVSGYQFTLNWDPKVLQFARVESGSLEGNFGTHNTQQGKLTTLWTDPDGKSQSLSNGTAIFLVHFKVIGNGGTESKIEINSALTGSVAYTGKLQQLTIHAKEAVVKVKGRRYALYQNYPNPFNEQTAFHFELPEEQQVELSIYNALGQAVKQFSGRYKAGEHVVNWKGEDEAGKKLATGTYFCRMKAGKFTGTVQIILAK